MAGSSLRSGKPEAYNPTLLGAEIGFILPINQPLEATLSFLSNPKNKIYLRDNQTEEAGALHFMAGLNYWFSSNFGAGLLLGFAKQTQTLENPGSGLEKYNTVTVGTRAVFETELSANIKVGAEIQGLWIPNFYSGFTLANLGFVKIHF